MRTTKWRNLLAMILALALLVSTIPTPVYAMAGEALAALLESTDTVVLQPNATPDPVLSTAHIVAEDESRRGETYKEYVMNNGLRLATVYPSAIHYEENGVWKDIDNTLVAAVASGKAVYQNAAGAWNVQFPQTLSGSSMVSVTKDGHTVQFSMAGEMRSSGGVAVASVGAIGQTEAANALAVSSAQTTTAQIQQIDLTAARAAAEHPETVLEKLNSRLSYANVYPNTNVVYDLQGNQLKESVVLQQYDADLWGYRYTLDTGDLVPVLREDQQIDLCDPETDEVVLTMPAPYMLDDNGETNHDVEVVLTQNGSKYLLSYYLPRAWLAETDRAWPVILDPVITVPGIHSVVDDITVAENYNEDAGRAVIQCGYSNNAGAMRFYMKFLQLPSLTATDVIVDATFRLKKPNNSGTTAHVSIYKVMEEWSQSDISWANQPDVGSDLEDYVVCKLADDYTWNITDMVRDWYENENYGMMFKVPDDIENGNVENWKQFYSSEYGYTESMIPFLAITYQNHNGLEDYWGYSSVSAGRAGTGYVNLFTGNMVWVRGDLGFDGNRMPVSVSHVYNSNDSQSNNFGMGNGWRTNYHQTITLSGGVYSWEDGDGTRHYFYQAKNSEGNTIANTYLDEDGLHLTLTTGGSGNQTYTLTDQMGNKSYFDTEGRLVKIENNQQAKSSITITYKTTTSKLISTVTDGAGRVYEFIYINNLLSRISYKGSGNNELMHVLYTYNDEGDLVKITDIDGLYTTYTYVEHLLTKVEDVADNNANNPYAINYYITCSYEENPTDEPIKRVYQIEEFNKMVSQTIPGSSATFTYSQHYTMVEDHSFCCVFYQFNDWGNVVAIHDSTGRAQYTKYAINDVNESIANTAELHQVLEISDIDSSSSNRIANSSFENGIPGERPSGWLAAGKISSNHTYSGVHAMRVSTDEMNGDNVRSSGPSYNIEPGETYTFSAYVLVVQDSEDDSEKPADIVVSFGGSEYYISETPNGWTRIQLSYTNEGTATETVHPDFFVVSGTIYVDCVQVEKADAANPYNEVENGDFIADHIIESGENNCWLDNDGDYVSNYYRETNSPNWVAYNGALALDGEPNEEKGFKQTIYLSGKAGEAVVLSGWAKANALPLTGNREFGLKLTIYYFNYSEEFYVSFDADIDSECWQYAAITAVPSTQFSHVTVELIYNNQANTVYFDGIHLTKGRAGTTYTYDSNKNVETETNILGQTTEYTYHANGIDLVWINTSAGSDFSYEYDTYHNVIQMVEATADPSGANHETTYQYEYDDYGNIESLTITKGSLIQKSITEYTANGNYVYKITDSNGNTTTYGYNLQTGVLDWVQYPEDTIGTDNTIDTRTHYVYDEMLRLIEVYYTTSQNESINVQYSYKNDLLETITTRSTTYRFEYNNLKLVTRVHVDDQVLAEYTYTNDRDHNLSCIQFGNGDRIYYSYDPRGRIYEEAYLEAGQDTHAAQITRYYYDNAGIPVRTCEITAGIESGSFYDSAGRITGYQEVRDRFYREIIYSYDANGNISSIDENIKEYGGWTGRAVVNRSHHSYEYLYDYKNRIETVKTDDAQKNYSYDDLDRLTDEVINLLNGDGSAAILRYEYTYRSATVGGTEVTTNQVSNKTITANGYSSDLTYEYDGNGNIIRYSFRSFDGIIKTITYEYDSANQLIRENNEEAGTTWVWTYDDAGNIISEKEYNYTTGEIQGSPRYTHYYNYYDINNPIWRDRLIDYDGSTIDYDEIGNPLSDSTWNYTWHCRRLASMENSLIEWQYTYDSNGMRTERSNGTDTYIYTYTNGRLSKLTKGDKVFCFTYDATGTPLTIKYDNVTYYYVTNLQGDVIAILNDEGFPMVEYTYDAWGVPVSACYWGTLPDLYECNPYLYRGYIFDRETGLYYIQGRYYNPEIGRFIQPADITTSSDPNMYRYTVNLSGGTVTSGSLVGTAGSTSSDMSAYLEMPFVDVALKQPSIHWEGTWIDCGYPSFLVASSGKDDFRGQYSFKAVLVEWGLSLGKGSLYFDEAENYSLSVTLAGASIFAGYNGEKGKFGVFGDVKVGSVGFEGKYLSAEVTAVGVGFIFGFENRKLRIKADPIGFLGGEFSIDFGQILMDCFGWEW